MPDPALEIRGGGAGGSSRPLDKRGPGLQKKFFRPFGPQFGLRLRGGGEGGGWALSWIRHWNMSSKHYVRGCQQQKWTLKPCEANKVSKTAIVIRSNLLQDCSSFFPFVFAMLFIPSFRVLSSFFMFHPVWWWFQLFEIWLITWHSSFNSLIRHCVCPPNFA